MAYLLPIALKMPRFKVKTVQKIHSSQRVKLGQIAENLYLFGDPNKTKLCIFSIGY